MTLLQAIPAKQVGCNHLAMISTYLPFFFPLEPAGPLRAVGAPSKSSIEVALLRDGAGRGGAPGGVAVPGTVAGRDDGVLDPGGAGLAEIDGGLPPSPGAAGGTLGLAVRVEGPAFGGGGVLRADVLPSGSFLLTHFLRLLS